MEVGRAGRPILAALHMLLSGERLFSMAAEQRLPALLANSRKHQSLVSTKLAGQVLEALYELLRGFQAADDPDALRAELEAKLASLRDPILTAEVFGVEEIIDPRDTRSLLIEFVRRAYEIVESEARGPKGRGMRP